MKGKTQPMKLRYFSIVPLLLVGCTDSVKDYNKAKVYYDVHYYFDYKTHTYLVFSDSDYQNKVGYCPLGKFYFVYSWEDNDLPKRIDNEYFVDTHELFVYNHK